MSLAATSRSSILLRDADQRDAGRRLKRSSDRELQLVRAPGPTSARFRTLVVVYGVAVVLATVFAFVTCEGTNWWSVGALALLFVVAEHRDRVFVDETGLSGSIAVALAASYFFASEGWVGGAFLCCAVGGLYVPHVRDRALSKIVINSASFGLSALATAWVLSLVERLRPVAGEVAIALLVAVWHLLDQQQFSAVHCDGDSERRTGAEPARSTDSVGHCDARVRLRRRDLRCRDG